MVWETARGRDLEGFCAEVNSQRFAKSPLAVYCREGMGVGSTAEKNNTCPGVCASGTLAILGPWPCLVCSGVPTPRTSTHHLLPPSCPSRAGGLQTLDLRVAKKLPFAETQLELVSTPWSGMEQGWPEEPVGRDHLSQPGKETQDNDHSERHD